MKILSISSFFLLHKSANHYTLYRQPQLKIINYLITRGDLNHVCLDQGLKDIIVNLNVTWINVDKYLKKNLSVLILVFRPLRPVRDIIRNFNGEHTISVGGKQKFITNFHGIHVQNIIDVWGGAIVIKHWAWK